MLLRYMIPGEIFILGHRPEPLDVSAVSAEFIHKGYRVRLTLPGGEMLELPEHLDLPRPFLKFVRRADGLHIVLTEEPGGASSPPLVELIPEERHSELLLLMREVGSRICRVIRNFGAVPAFPEKIMPRLIGDVRTHLLRWSPETSVDGQSWAHLIAQEPVRLGLLLGIRGSRESEFSEAAHLHVLSWPEVAEALEDNKEPTPELEFYANAMGHLRQRNYRLAVVEAVICLEIVFAQFLRVYLLTVKRIPKQRLRSFLSPEIGLSARLSALLDLTLHESWLRDIDLGELIKVVGWRNSVVHKTGRLPPGLTEEVLERGVSSVLSLAEMLAERRDNVAATASLQRIAKALRREEDMLWPQIWLKRRHVVRMDIEFSTVYTPPYRRDRMEAVTKEAAELLKERDPRFDPNKHLTIHFKDLADKSLGWFSAGALHVSEEASSESKSVDRQN